MATTPTVRSRNARHTGKTARKRGESPAQRILCAAMSLVLAIGLAPFPAFADTGADSELAGPGLLAGSIDGEGGLASGEQDASSQGGNISGSSGSEEPGEGAGSSAASNPEGGMRTAPLAATNAAEDPFYFQDVQTGEVAYTLHTSGTYQLVTAGGSPYIDEDLLDVSFEMKSVNPRNEGDTYSVNITRQMIEDGNGDYETQALFAENLAEQLYASNFNWQIPTGTYRIKGGDYENPSYFAQEYRIINDGLFNAYFDLSSSARNTFDFSVKPYDPTLTDADYDERVYNEETSVYEDKVRDEDAFALAADARLRIAIDSAIALEKEDGTPIAPELESIGLWKAEEGATVESMQEAFEQLAAQDMASASRIEGVGTVLPWPNALNFADDSKVTYLWERGDSELGERFVGAEASAQSGASSGKFIVDCANFANAVIESGLYFPIVTATINGETYTYAYYPIEVDASGTAERADPRILTTTLANARKGNAYSAALTGRSGAKADGAFTWSISEGTLPDGLQLDADTGVIAGTPAESVEAGSFSFTVALAETAAGDTRTATRAFTLDVSDKLDESNVLTELTLGEIGYTPATIWASKIYNNTTKVNLSIPISVDLREPADQLGLDLSGTELWYMMEMVATYDEKPKYYVWHENAASLMSDDGTTLNVPAIVERGFNNGPWEPKSIVSMRAFLVPKHADGTYAFEPGELADAGADSSGAGIKAEPIEEVLAYRYGDGKSREDSAGSGRYLFVDDNGSSTGWTGDLATYAALPDMPRTPVVKHPEIVFGSWVYFPELEFEGDPSEWPITEGRVRIWPYDGKAASGACLAEETLSSGGAIFKLAPGSYIFTVEGELPLFDEYGNSTGKTSWIDIANGAENAWLIKGTRPQQYVFSLGPNEGGDKGTDVQPLAAGAQYTDAGIESAKLYHANVEFQPGDGNASDADHQTSWYRFKGDPESAGDLENPDNYVLVGTGDYMMLGPSDYPLYVEAAPIGRDTAFWKSSGKQLVEDDAREIDVTVPRQDAFSGTFTLKRELLDSSELETLSGGGPYGMLEVRIPIDTDDHSYTSRSMWANSNPITVPNLTSGAIVTFTPRADLQAGPVSFTVPESQEESFEQELVAPLPQGVITFDDLRFKGADAVDDQGDVTAAGRTARLSLTDDNVSVVVKRDGADAPFSIIDGKRILLQPNDWDYDERTYHHEFTTSSKPVEYEITIGYRDPNAPARLGVVQADYAAKKTFTIQLSKGATSATVAAAESLLTSRGYALVPLENPSNKACTLLLYDNLGEHEGEYVNGDGSLDRHDGNLVDRHDNGGAGVLRTPFLDEGNYTLYAVDTAAMPKNEGGYESIHWLYTNVLNKQAYEGHWTTIDLVVENGKITTSESLVYPTWAAEGTEQGLINLGASSVKVDSAYANTLSIQMHAELNKGVELSKNARLEVVTNQATRDNRTGLMNPRALTLNGVTQSLNRWDNAFNETQHMNDGSLTILLSKTKGVGSSAKSFPLDMTLVIPTMGSSSFIEASVWLVDGAKSSLVGTYRAEKKSTSLVAPSTVAWNTFYVYGETTPYAMVTVFLNGMRAATEKADIFGYYTAEITLPDEMRDFEEFTLTASAQWNRDGTGYSATSETAKVMYTNTLPVLERIIMCYQKDAQADYDSIVTYYRGKMPNKYLSLYRAEHDPQRDGEEHAKHFWLAEFTNGDNIGSVTMSVPRENGSVTLESTDDVKTAESWIPGMKLRLEYSLDDWVLGSWIAPSSATGALVRTALQSTDTRAFVSKPEVFNYSPGHLNVSYGLAEIDEDSYIEPLRTASDLWKDTEGGFRGFKTNGLTQESLTRSLEALADSKFVHRVSEDNIAVSASEWAESLMAREDGTVDEWLMLGNGAESSYLKVHHQTTLANGLSEDEIDGEVQEILAGVTPAIEAFERWIETGNAPDNGELAKYDGRWIWDAGDSQRLGSESDLYYIETADDLGNMQIEALHKFAIESTGKHLYYLFRYNKDSYTMISWNEKTGQKMRITYTIADESTITPDQEDVSPDLVTEYGSVDTTGLMLQWYHVFAALHAGFNAALLADDSQAAGDAAGTAGTSSIGGNAGTLSHGTTSLMSLRGTLTEIGETLATWYGKWTGEAVGALPEPSTFKPRLKEHQTSPAFDRTHPQYWDQPERLNESTLGGAWFRNGMALHYDMSVSVTADATLNGIGARGGPSGWLFLSNFFLNDAKDAMEQHYKGTEPEPEPEDGDEESPEEQAEKEKEADYEGFKVQIMYKRCKLKYHLQPYRLKYDDQTLKDWEDRANKELQNLENLSAELNDTVYDPSGIVYEGVLSNPVAGATVKLYTYNKAAANAGLDAAQFIDSSQFGIEDNPQITGADGRYQWFVPEGYWQVQVSKRGYEDFNTGDWGHPEMQPVYNENGYLVNGEGLVVGSIAEAATQEVWVGDYGLGATKVLYPNTPDEVEASTYWMPVLPIQLDVNIPLRSPEAPHVGVSAVDRASVDVGFSKYMKVSSLSADQFIVGGAPAARIEALDAEEAGDGSGEMLARRFRVYISSNASLPENGGSTTLALASGATATSYADVAIAESCFGQEYAFSVPAKQASSIKLAAQSKTYAAKALAYSGAVTRTGSSGAVSYRYYSDAACTKAVDAANVKSAGTYYVKATLAADAIYKAATSNAAKFTIAPKAITPAVTLATTSFTYNGKARTTSLTVKDGSTKLAASDYTVAYSKNKNAGTASVKVTLKGNYSGTKSVSFTIKKAAQTVTASNKTVAMGKTAKLGAKASAGGKLTYKSSNAKVAKVNASGKVTPVKVGKATITVKAAATANYAAASKKVTVKVSKGANPLSVKAKTATVKAAKVKKANQTLAVDNVLKFAKKGQGKLSYAKKSGNKKILVNKKTGEVTVKKGLKAGTYKVKVAVKAAGNANWKAGTRTVTFKVTVK